MTSSRRTALGLSYVSYRSYEGLDGCAARHANVANVLGVVAFGARPPTTALRTETPFIWVDMPYLEGEGYCEVWESGQPVEPVKSSGIDACHNEDILFGCLHLSAEDGLEEASRAAYSRLFDFIDGQGFPFLMRAWNYFPCINAETGGIERYRQFNIGRHDAFAAQGRTGSESSGGADMPAACALGSRGGPLNVYFLASRQAGRPVENPRQVSAFDYPERYGPRSPKFSRAMLMQPAGQRILSISGTASVVGHETRHAGDPDAQIAETIANIRALMDAAGEKDARPTPGNGELLLKAYLRAPGYLAAMQSALTQAFPDASVAYLQADICRTDLLVEVEGMYFGR